MNEQAQKILVDLLQKASNGIDSAVSFSQAQIPDVVHQLLVWNFASSIIAQAFSLVLILAVAIWLVKLISDRTSRKPWTCHKQDARLNETSELFDIVALISVIGGALAVVFSIIVFSCNFDWLKIWLAPKLYLIEYAASLVK